MSVARWGGYIVGALAIVVLVVVLLLAWLLFSNSGLQTVLNIAEGQLEGLSFESIEGSIGGELAIKELEFASEGLSVEIGDGLISWSPRALISRKLIIHTLHANNLTIRQSGVAPEVESDEAFTLPEEFPLPVEVVIQDAQVRNLRFYGTGAEQAFVMNHAKLVAWANTDELSIQTLELDSPIFSVNGTAGTQPAEQYSTQSELEWQLKSTDEMPAITGTLSASGDLERLLVDISAEVANGAQQLPTAELRGHIDTLMENPNAGLTLNWQTFVWPLVAEDDSAELVYSERGQLAVQGGLEKYNLTLAAAVRAQNIDTELNATANGTTEQLDITAMSVDALDGRLSGTASIDWAQELAAIFDIEAAAINPAAVSPEWPGEIDATLRGQYRDETLQLDALELEGLLRERPIQLSASGTFADEELVLQELDLQSGDTQLSSSGRVADTLDLSWSLQSPDAADLYPGVSGEISGAGRLLGSRTEPKLDAKLEAKQLRYADFSVKELTLDANVDLFDSGPDAEDSYLTLVGSDVQVAGQQLRTVKLLAEGRASDNSLQFQIDSEPLKLALQLSGALAEQAWQGQLVELSVAPADFAPWQQDAPAALSISAEQQSLSRSCWQSAQGSVCADFERSAADTAANFAIDSLPLNYVLSVVAPELDITGELNGEGTFTMNTADDWQGQLRLETSAFTFKANNLGTDEQLTPTLLSALPGEILLSATPELAEVSLLLPLEDSEGINVQLSVDSTNSEFTDGNLSGTAKLAINDLAFVSELSDELNNVEAAISASFNLEGTPSDIKPSGELQLSGGNIDLSTPGLALSNINLTGTGEADGSIEFLASVTADEGVLDITGSSNLKSGETQLSVKGERVQLWNTADAQVWASPDVTLTMVDDAITLTGEVLVPEAQITPQEIPASAVSVSEDQIIIDSDEQPDAVEGLAPELVIALSLQLGDAVNVESFGFSGRIEGTLDVEQSEGRPLSGSGELNILDGEYRAYGQGLVIEQGQVLFAGGPIDSPGFRVRAARRPADDIVVGVNLRGDLAKPEIALFSEPSMSQTEQLSWLVLGRSLQTTSGSETDYMAQAALALGLRGNDFLANNIGDKLGLDTFALEAGSGEAGAASDVSSAALVVGKFLTPKLYLSYGVGLLDSLSTVRLNYAMTSRWNLSTESSALSSGGDLSYTFEK